MVCTIPCRSAPNLALFCLVGIAGFAVGTVLTRWAPSLAGTAGTMRWHTPEDPRDRARQDRTRRWVGGLAGTVSYLAIYLRFGLSLEGLELTLLATALLLSVLTDLEARIIPNGCVVFAAVVRIVYLALAWVLGQPGAVGSIRASLVGALVIGGGTLAIALIADHLLGHASIGGGDIKLFAVGGLYFGWMGGLLMVLFSCGFGLALMCGIASLRDEDNAFAFAPGIALACLVLMLGDVAIEPWVAALLL